MRWQALLREQALVRKSLMRLRPSCSTLALPQGFWSWLHLMSTRTACAQNAFCSPFSPIGGFILDRWFASRSAPISFLADCPLASLLRAIRTAPEFMTGRYDTSKNFTWAFAGFNVLQSSFWPQGMRTEEGINQLCASFLATTFHSSEHAGVLFQFAQVLKNVITVITYV